MELRTLDEFLALGWSQSRFPRAEYVAHPDFCDLYVRIGPRYLRTTMPPYASDGVVANPVITIAKIEATNKGQGCFTRLLNDLKEKYPWPIYVECVHNERLGKYLERRGFLEIAGVPRDYVVSPDRMTKLVRH